MVVETCSWPSHNAMTVTSTPGQQEPHRGGVSQGVRGDVLGPQGRTGLAGPGDVEGDAVFDGVAAEGPAGDWSGTTGSVAAPSRSVSQPPQDGDGERHQRCSSLFSPFADGVDVGAGAEGNVGEGEAGQFGDPEAGLDGQDQHGVVAPPGPGRPVAGSEEDVDFLVGEVGDEVAFEPLGRDGQHPLDRRGVFGMVQSGVGEERVDRRPGGCCGCGRRCAGLVRGGPGRRRSAGRRGLRCRVADGCLWV